VLGIVGSGVSESTVLASLEPKLPNDPSIKETIMKIACGEYPDNMIEGNLAPLLKFMATCILLAPNQSSFFHQMMTKPEDIIS